jgi:mannose/fructose/N-acetylgalactosamine-specific phosphotransferase system component IIC
MNNIKEVFYWLDGFFTVVWGVTIIDLIPSISMGYVFTSVDNVIKIAFSLVGLVYALCRLIFYVIKSQQEIIKMKRENGTK